MKLLVVDDDKTIREMLRFGLESERFMVFEADSMIRAVESACTEKFDCIILDNILGDGTGVEACKRIRAAGVTTPIIGLSVRTEIEQKVTFLNAGADDYIEKPFSFSELIARIHAITRRRHNDSVLSDEICFGEGFRLNSLRSSVTKDSELLHLTKKEYLLLEYLLKNRGILVTRAMILENVWNMRFDPFSNTIDCHVASLRRKLGDSYKNSLIKTVVGRGYLID